MILLNFNHPRHGILCYVPLNVFYYSLKKKKKNPNQPLKRCLAKIHWNVQKLNKLQFSLWCAFPPLNCKVYNNGILSYLIRIISLIINSISEIHYYVR